MAAEDAAGGSDCGGGGNFRGARVRVRADHADREWAIASFGDKAAKEYLGGTITSEPNDAGLVTIAYDGHPAAEWIALWQVRSS